MKRGTLAALVVLALAPVVFALSPLRADAAFQACACRCLDRANTETVRIDVAADCRTACIANRGDHTAEQLAGSSRVRTASGADKCQCEWSMPTTRLEWTPKTAGRTACDGDCAQACGGAANVDPAQSQNQNTRTIDCTRDDHCAQGVFAVYAQRNNCAPGDENCGAPYCEYQTLPEGETAANAYDGVRPRCIIPATALNADIECQTYGGNARGGVCRKFDPGENLAQYSLTRPYVSNGAYSAWPINTTNPPITVEQLNSRLNTDTHAPSLCELYGETQDVVIGIQTPTYSDYRKNVVGVTFGEANLPAGAQPLSVSASKRYVCAVKKINTCGTVKPETSDLIQTASAYRCIDPVNIPTGSVESICFGESRSETELCVNSPGTRCCAEAAGGCYSDVDCVLPRKCVKTTHSALGTCQYVTVCDDENTSRRCRAATLTERANPSICSPEIAPGTARCGTGTMACCGPTPSNLLSPCAADLINETVIINEHQTQFTSAMASEYSCFDMSELRKLPTEGSSIWMESGMDTILRPFVDGGACLTNNDPAALRSGAPSVQRCSGAQSVCCRASLVGQQQLLDDLNNRPGSGASCGPSGKGFTCIQYPSMSEVVLNRFGFQNAWSYQTALAASPYCQISPVFGSSFTNSRECRSGMVCCASAALSNAWCSTDANCNSSGEECDEVIHHCVPVGSREKQSATNCVEVARQNGEPDVSVIATPGTESTFQCQRVPDTDREANRTLCLQRGCESEGDAGEGYSFRCCFPGTGEAPGAAAAAAANAQAKVEAAPSSIKWASCIASGNCSLDEIVASGAAFANFLVAISGSVFLAIFVYAGFIYLTAGSSSRVEGAKKMLTQATMGMVLLLGAYVFIRFIQQTFVSNALNASKTATCGNTPETKGGSYQCTWLNVDASDSKALSKEISEKKCLRNLCPGDTNYVCCPTQIQE